MMVIRYEKVYDNALVCSNLSAVEVAGVLDQTIQNCLKCSVLNECNPGTNMTVQRILDASNTPAPFNRLQLLYIGKKVNQLECNLLEQSFDVPDVIDWKSFTIQDRFVRL